MIRKEILDGYLAKHDVPEPVVKKINVNSFLTENFAYNALRIGNSIGDLLNISIEIVLLDEIAKKYNLTLDTTEHAELHSKGVSEKDLDNLVKGAMIFENTIQNKKQYKFVSREIADYIRKEMRSFVSAE